MRKVDYADERGRMYRVLLPPDAPDEEASSGIPVGPPDVVDAVGLPEPMATRLHNLLHKRGLFDVKTVRRTPQALQSAIQSAYRVDVHILMQAYIESEKETPVIGEDGRQ
ncbi:MAG: hypothetical protein GTO22_03545 [Gemmatimonadales bacterium]|nr:hypothetical protein [Gemmatimonadales bacterium]